MYAIVVELDTEAMKKAGMTPEAIAVVQGYVLPNALYDCGFIDHPQQSLYCNGHLHQPIPALMSLQTTLQKNAPEVCRYLKCIHVLKVEEISNVTSLVKLNQQDDPD
jgi:hypothetical protein